MTFAEKVLKVRMQLFMSQKALAKELGVSFATVNRWEKEHTHPSLLAQKAFAEFCKRNNIKVED